MKYTSDVFSHTSYVFKFFLEKQSKMDFYESYHKIYLLETFVHNNLYSNSNQNLL